MPTLYANTGVMQTMPVVLNSGLSVKAKALNYVPQKVQVLQKGLETKRKMA